MARIFNQGLLPYMTCFHHSFQSVIYPWFDFGVSFSWEVCNQAQGSLLPYLIDPYGWVHQTPLLCLLGDTCCRGIGYLKLSMGFLP